MMTEPRAIAPDPGVLRLGTLTLSTSGRSATLAGVDLGLSGTEFALLWTLAAGQDECVSVGTLLRAAGWEESTAALIYLDLYVRYLREKLEDDPERPAVILAVRRSGFMLSSGALRSSATDLLRRSTG